MSSPYIQLNILPDIEIINTFKTDERTTIPNNTYTLTGTVEIMLARPIQIRQLYVQFQGQIDCLISTADFYRIHEPSNTNQRDEIPLSKWNTIDTNELGLIDKIMRKALGQSNASLTVIDKRVMLIDTPQELKMGKTCWPFAITINNMHLLPPSILLPHHLIQYNLAAKIKLNSLGERVKLTYWHARMNTLRRKSSSSSGGGEGEGRGMNSFDSSSTANLPPLSPADTITTTATTTSSITTTTMPSITVSHSRQRIYNSDYTAITTADNANSNEQGDISQHSNNTDLISATLMKSNANTNNSKRQLLDVNKIIQICRHSYSNLLSLHAISRIRYRGSRKNRIEYEISMSKFTCIQKKTFSFTCKFNSLCQDTKIDALDFYLEQNEAYP